MKSIKTISAIGLVVLNAAICGAADLPRSAPEAQGVSSSAVLDFVQSADKDLDSLNSFMLLRHGHVVAEGWWGPYRANAPHSLYSLSKSFTSTAVGLAVSEGKLSVDDEVLKFFPEDAPAKPDENLKKMRVSDLLRMSTGQQTEPPRTAETPWVKTFLEHPVPFKPGTHFFYNTSATYMQSAIVQRATGFTVLDYLRPRLFEPLGIQNPTWETSPQGISTGGYGLSIRTEDIARFGQLYLQKGMWQGKRLIPEAWVEAATSRQTSNGSNPASDWDQGYGYQFWRGRHGCFRGDGAFGQFCIVLPDQDAVIAITSGVNGMEPMQAILNLVWDKLLPALKTGPLPADDASQKKLETTLKGLSLRPQEGSGHPAKVSGKKYVFPANEHKLEAIRIESNGGDVTVVMQFEGAEHRIDCGHGKWSKGSFLREQPISASGAWTSDDTFTAKFCFYETPFVNTVNLKFSNDEVQYRAKPNTGFGIVKEYQLVGTTREVAQNTLKPAAADSDTSQVVPTKSNSVPSPPAEAPPGSRPKPHDFAKWEKNIVAFEAEDKVNPPPKGGILFVGSSTIVLWKTLAQDFPDHKVINRGFGGSEIVDSTYYADRMVIPYEPKQIFVRCGGNDLNAGRLPEEVANDFVEFVNKVHRKLPKTEIYYVSVSPAPARWGQIDKTKALNDMIRADALHLRRVGFIDTFEMTLDSKGQARKELFVPDMLHLNAEGYKLLTAAVRPYLPVIVGK